MVKGWPGLVILIKSVHSSLGLGVCFKEISAKIAPPQLYLYEVGCFHILSVIIDLIN